MNHLTIIIVVVTAALLSALVYSTPRSIATDLGATYAAAE